MGCGFYIFPNTDNELGLGAVKRALETRDQLLPPTSRILEDVEICLKSNHSVFNEKVYLQIHGTAVGPKNTCSYSDLAIGEIDHKAYKFCGPIKHRNGGDIVTMSLISDSKVALRWIRLPST